MAAQKNTNSVTTMKPHSKSAMKQTFPSNIKGARKAVTKKNEFMLYGGPFGGSKVWLTTPSTTTFSSGKFKGRYRPGSFGWTGGPFAKPVTVPVDEENFKGFDLIWEEC